MRLLFSLSSFIACLMASPCNDSHGQVNLTKHVRPVHVGTGSTGLSIYDTSPESPDGKYVCFIHYPGIVQGGHRAGVARAEVLIKNRLTGETKTISDTRATNHNGANAFWVDNARIAFMGNYLQYFEVYDADSGTSLFGPVKGELGHKSFGGEIFYSACNLRLLEPNKFRERFPETEEGIYRLDCATGERELIVSKARIHEAFMAQNPRVTGAGIQILHVEPSPDNKAIMFDFRQQGLGNVHGFVRADGTGIRWVPVRPMHVVWYDNASMFGVDTKDPEKKIYKYDLQGNPLEMLGGTSTHAGASPDRNWYVGESAYYKPEDDGYTRVYLYKRGSSKPAALLSEWRNSKISWAWVAHANPSFSADGERIYFIRASDEEDRFEAVFLDISAHLGSLN